MYFCSIEHQKLVSFIYPSFSSNPDLTLESRIDFRFILQVWPVHKRVCGSAFKWPLLRPKERDEIIDLSTKSFRIDPDDLEVGRRKRWIDSYEEVAIETGYDSETIFRVRTSGPTIVRARMRLTDP